jgi:hypothetical protein
MEFDWIDELLDNSEAEAEMWQLDTIDNLIRSTSIGEQLSLVIERESINYTKKEAFKIISYLKRNQTYPDCRDRFKFYNNKNN